LRFIKSGAAQNAETAAGQLAQRRREQRRPVAKIRTEADVGMFNRLADGA
jgi:hypothetical protein